VKAILLAGGLGTRLRPITLTCPKPLLPIGNLPLIQRIVLNLRAHGIKEFIFLLHDQPQRFVDALGDGRMCDVRFQYVIMEKDLSTAGSVKFAAKHITETTLIYSGDILADLPLHDMLAFHRQRRALATLALHPITAPLPFGLVLREGDGRIRHFFEKPTWPQVFSDWINAAIYLIEPELLAHIPAEARPVFFEQEVFPPLAASRAAIFGFPITGYWRDVGTPEDLRLANRDYLQGKLPKKMLTPDELTWHIPATDKNASHYVLGLGSKIAPDAQIEASVIGANCCIDSHAKIHGAVIFDDVQIGKGVQVNDAILMPDVDVAAKAEIHSGAVLAEGAQVGAAAIVDANAIVRRELRVAPGETVDAKRVLPTGYIRRFVDGGSLLGSAHSGMSTEFMRWVGKAFALRQNNEKRKTDGEEKPVTLLLATQEEERFTAGARALVQGMLSAGCEVHLLESVTLPMTREVLQKGRYAGSIYLGADRHAALLRLALMHASAEDFTTEESCSLERIDLIDASIKGNLQLLEVKRYYEDYLRRAISIAGVENYAPPNFAPQAGSVLDRPIPLRVGVVGQAAEQLVSQFLAMFGCPAAIDVFPLDMSSGFRRHMRQAQKTFVQTITHEVGIGIWIGGVGERIQLALPDHGLLPRGCSDAAIARMLLQESPDAQLIAGWLFPNWGQSPSHQIQRYEGCMLTAANLRAKPATMRRFGFDGRGAITFPPWSGATTNGVDETCAAAHPDALLAMALVLRILLKTRRAEFENMLTGATLGYRLMSCPDEAKAYLMRRLVETYDHLDCAFSDGIRLEDKNSDTPNWVVVRPCAGMPALEIYWEDNRGRRAANRKSKTSLNVAIRRQLARWRAL